MNQQSAPTETPSPIMRMMQRLMPKITPIHVWMYRALGGRIVNQATGGAPALLVTTIGRRSGLSRTVVVGYLPDGDDVIVAGTNGGLPALPSWVLNLRANPEAEVELGQERFSARAEWLEGSELEDHWQRFVTGYPPYEQARQWAGREVPLIRLRRVESAAE